MCTLVLKLDRLYLALCEQATRPDVLVSTHLPVFERVEQLLKAGCSRHQFGKTWRVVDGEPIRSGSHPVAPFEIWPRNLCPPERSCQLLPYTLVGGLEGDVEIVDFGPAGGRSRQVLVGLGSRSHSEASDGPLEASDGLLALKGRDFGGAAKITS